MGISRQFAVIFTITFLLTVLCKPSATAIVGLETTFIPSTTASPSPTPRDHDLQEHSFFSHTALLHPILSHLGFNELATAAPSLVLDSSITASGSAWTGPSTLFAPSDASLRTCFSCSIPSILREHLVPGLFTIDYLRKLAFGTKIETLSPGRCITVTNDSFNRNATSKVFIGGVEITQPDLFNNGLLVIHGLQGYISPLSPLSCDVERMSSLSFPFHQEYHRSGQFFQPSGLMRLMLRDAILRLRNNGFSILALAMKVKYAELVTLNNMTVFAIDDVSIFSGSHTYIGNVRFHIVPNQLLSIADLEKLPVGTPLPTLDRGQSLLITTSGGSPTTAPMRINYVRVKIPEVIRNVKIMVHSVYLPFPHVNPVAAAYDSILGGGGGGGGSDSANNEPQDRRMEGSCAVLEEHGGCGETPMPRIKPDTDIEDHHGL